MPRPYPKLQIDETHLLLLVDGAEDDLSEPLFLEHPEGDSPYRPPLLVHQRYCLVSQVEDQPLDVALKLVKLSI